ncbi:MAG: M6 family metalloprotease domain-containing protein [Muribaculaceae bacterium]|nr:M6 family metalloprotease domain-containing protein [Muribaculaceae bacterium]
MKHKLLISLGLTLAATGTAFAVPARPGQLRTVTQPDGSVLTIMVTGDERTHRVTTADGTLLIYDETNGYTYATVGADGLPVSSGILAADNTTGVARSAAIDPVAVEQAFELRDKMLLTDSSRMRSITPRALRAPKSDTENDEQTGHVNVGRFSEDFPVKGEQKGLVVLVEYTNLKFTLEDPHDYFTRLLNEPGFSDLNGTGSARDWYIENSNGLFVPEFDVYGPVTLSHSGNYYGGNDSWGNDRRPEELAIEACQMLDETVDFSEYDRDGDGVIDNIFIFYAGYGEADGGAAWTIWPHSWEVTTARPNERYEFDGVQLDRYACASELEGNGTPDGIGTFVHEFSHVMGLPDLYATSYTGAFTPGSWSVMDMGPYNNDGRTPPNYSAYERYCLDWLQPMEIEMTSEVVLNPMLDNNEAFIVHTEKQNEFFILENRQQEGNDRYLPGHGMLVWHIDYNPGIWDANIVNNQPTHQYVDLIEADNKRDDISRAGDAFPGTKNVTEFGPTTKPAFVDWNKQPVEYTLNDIQEIDRVITFTSISSAVKDIASDLQTAGAWAHNGILYTSSDTALTVYDITGRNVGTVSASAPLSLSVSGIYIVRLSNNSAVKVRL